MYRASAKSQIVRKDHLILIAVISTLIIVNSSISNYGYFDITKVVIEFIRDQQEVKTAQSRQVEELRIEQNFKDISEAYFAVLSERQLSEYEQRIKKQFGSFMKLEKNTDSYISMIKDCIIEDMKSQRLDIDKLKLSAEMKVNSQ